jgi:hypothetical protein
MARRAAQSADYRAAQEQAEPGWLSQRLLDPEFRAAYEAAGGSPWDGFSSMADAVGVDE